MTKAVFTTKATPSYKDLPEERYHFPRTYLNFVQQAVGDYIVYYEPRRTVQWMFDRGLISIGDDYKILISKSHVPEEAVRLLNQSGSINLPKDQTLYPMSII